MSTITTKTAVIQRDIASNPRLFERNQPKYFYVTQNISNIAKRLDQIAVPIVILLGLSNLPGADGGPIGYGVCVGVCAAALAATGGFAFPAYLVCVAECLAVLAAPTP